MKRRHIAEAVGSILFVFGLTYLVYQSLVSFPLFWNVQTTWSIALVLCWIFVSAGYFHQGWLVHARNDAKEVSLLLPSAVFIVQCILFVKGIYYHDWSFVLGAVIVNSGVVFSLVQIFKARRRSARAATRERSMP